MRRLCSFLFSTLLLINDAYAEGMYVFPKQGQGQEQQSVDAGGCRAWAIRQTGVDPAYVQGQLAMMQSQAASQPRQMPVARSAFRGVTTGAMMGRIADNNEDLSERGAKMGAAYGLKSGISQRIDMQRQAQADQAQAQMQNLQASQDEYMRAFAACMDAKGYSVR